MSQEIGQPLLFPLLSRWGESVVRIYGEGFVKHRLKKHLGGDRFLFSHGGTSALRVFWFIDREGRIRRVEPKAYRRAWARPLAAAKVIDLVLVELEIQRGTQILVSELVQELTNMKSPPGFPTGRQLRAFLSKRSQSALFDASMFREFWEKHGPPLSEEEWKRQIPP